jgi:hypothetical protein
MTQSAKLASEHGLRKGMAKAATKVNPALMVADAVLSVADCIHSFIQLAEAREIRDCLARENPLLIKKLAAQRQELVEQVEVARKQLDIERQRREALAGLVKTCQELFSKTMKLFTEARSADLPQLDELDKLEDRLFEDWHALKGALAFYQGQIAEEEADG